MGYRTPNIDRIAREGAILTDYYASNPARQAGRRSSPVKARCGPDF
jgi:arylsulfatase A-like enzyme